MFRCHGLHFKETTSAGRRHRSEINLFLKHTDCPHSVDSVYIITTKMVVHTQREDQDLFRFCYLITQNCQENTSYSRQTCKHWNLLQRQVTQWQRAPSGNLQDGLDCWFCSGGLWAYLWLLLPWLPVHRISLLNVWFLVKKIEKLQLWKELSITEKLR